jgi:hypothetical protein
MIDSERGRCNANVPFHLPDALEYKFLGCIPDHHQLRMASNGIAMAVQAGLGWGGGGCEQMCTLHAGVMLCIVCVTMLPDRVDDSFTSTICLYLSPSQLCLKKRMSNFKVTYLNLVDSYSAFF